MMPSDLPQFHADDPADAEARWEAYLALLRRKETQARRASEASLSSLPEATDSKTLSRPVQIALLTALITAIAAPLAWFGLNWALDARPEPAAIHRLAAAPASAPPVVAEPPDRLDGSAPPVAAMPAPADERPLASPVASPAPAYSAPASSEPAQSSTATSSSPASLHKHHAHHRRAAHHHVARKPKRHVGWLSRFARSVRYSFTSH